MNKTVNNKSNKNWLKNESYGYYPIIICRKQYNTIYNSHQ